MHTIHINQIGAGIYACTGAVSITRTATPIRDAARELLARGESPDDELHTICGECSIAPMSLASLLRERPKPYSFAA